MSDSILIEFDRETDGRWIAEVIDLPGVLAYGQNREEAERRVKSLALRVIEEQQPDRQS